MFSTGAAFLIIFVYLLLLFLVASYAEARERKGRSLVSNPYVYALSLAVYCTSWTFYGSVGKAANSGLSFLPTYIGPTLMASLWWVVLRKIVIISKRSRITTLSDFIASRYGKSLRLSALVTVVVVVGIAPYLGLQLKAIMTTFSILVGRPEGSSFAGWLIALMLGVFAVMFGARRLDASERHGGLVFAVAFESAIKIVAFVGVGVFVAYGLFDGFSDILGRIEGSEYAYLMRMGEGSRVSYMEWTSLTLLSMMAVMFLPRQFHVAVVENTDVEHIRKAMWLFPLYLLLINVFVLPIAYGGLLLGGAPEEADYFVLTIPLGLGYPALALMAFIGGFSAATAMVIVSSLALSTMVTNSMVVPLLLRLREEHGLHDLILNIKRLVIVGCVFLGYVFAVHVGEFYSLVDMGLKSFEAVTILAPAVLLGIYWKGGNEKGAMAGIGAGFAIWIYTLLVPALLRAGIVERGGAWDHVFGGTLLNPTALFGLAGLDRWSHSLFWGMFFNLFFFVGVSVLTRQSDLEVRQAMLFVDTYNPSYMTSSQRTPSLGEIEDIMRTYLGREEAREFVEGFRARSGLGGGALSGQWLIKLREEAEIVLSGAFGPSISTLIFQGRSTLTPGEKREISESIRNISRGLRLSREELAEANRQLALLKEFSENIIESMPLGVATLDEDRRVKYWNKSMERIVGVTKDEALGLQADMLLRCLEPDVFGPRMMPEGEFMCRKKEGAQMMLLKVYLSSLTGAQRGYVVVFEDVTEKKRIEEELFRATKHAGIGRLAAGVSHEIGNPLASISSLVQELLALDVSAFERRSIETVSDQVARIARIVRNLGDFARMSPRERVPARVSDILDKTLSLIRYDKGFRNIEISTRALDASELMLDPDQMQQVFLNLLLNAKDAMPEGGKIDISIARVGGWVEIAVSDTGEGIGPGQVEKVFDPFFTTKHSSRETGRGTGLGLSICYSIVKDHGGSIEVVSEKGAGTRFTLRLPVRE